MNQIVKVEDRQRRAVIEVQDPVPLLDTSQFEHMQRIATVMARTSLIPESLYKEKDQELPFERIISNCFLVVNQAVRWGMDPFAVAQCVAVVKGKLCYEGKLVSAVLDAKLGVRLHHHFAGSGDELRIYLCDRPFDEQITVDVDGEKVTGALSQFVKPGFRFPGFRLFDGSVGEWKTTGNNSRWSQKNFPRMLVYRGTRDWTRIYEPAIMLGVYTPDEMLDLAENARSLRARDVTDRPSLTERLAAAKGGSQTSEGFNRDFVASETAALTSGPEIEKHEPSDNPSSDAADDSPIVDQGSGSSPPNAAPDNSADEAETSETGGQPSEATNEAHGESSTLPVSETNPEYSRAKCIDKMLAVATNEKDYPEPRDRLGALADAADMWLAHHDKSFVNPVFERCKAVIKGENDVAAARRYLETL